MLVSMDVLNSEMYRSAYEAAILANQKSSSTWAKYKDDLNTTQKLLQDLPLSLSKQSCDESLKKLQAEATLMQNKLELLIKEGVFGEPDRPSLIEHVTEEEYQEQAQRHRLMVKRDRQQAAETQSEVKNAEEEYWDMLELQEELRDEMQRLQNGSDFEDDDDSSDDHDDDDDDDDESSLTDIDDNEALVTNETATNGSPRKEIMSATSEPQKDENKRKRSVVFVDDANKGNEEEPPLVLNFKHSSAVPVPVTYTPGAITSPADMYLSYQQQLHAHKPLSILKVKDNPNAVMETSAVAAEADDSSDDAGPAPQPVMSSGYVIPDVVTTSGSVHVNATSSDRRRPISKFKASRQKLR